MPYLRGFQHKVVQQLDVMPTVLHLAGYKGRYMSFGGSVLAGKANGYAVQRMDYVNQVVDSSHVLGLSTGNDAIVYLYNYRTDPKLNKNLLLDSTVVIKKLELEKYLKAMIQRHNYGFIHNRLFY
jgi:phosphoglycerol transferase MdoB-like AlkP superfamily enzyme